MSMPPQPDIAVALQRQMSTATGLSVTTFCAWLPNSIRATPRTPMRCHDDQIASLLSCRGDNAFRRRLILDVHGLAGDA
jgi:hypothetical protein